MVYRQHFLFKKRMVPQLCDTRSQLSLDLSVEVKINKNRNKGENKIKMNKVQGSIWSCREGV